MRRSSARRLTLFECALVVAFAAGCGSGVEISLQVGPGCCDASNKTFDTRGVGFLHVTVTNGAKADEGTFPVDTGKQTLFPLKNVDRLRAVHVDVLGCNQATCAQTSDASFRGCTRDDVPVESDSSCINGVTNPCTVPAFIELDPIASENANTCDGLLSTP